MTNQELESRFTYHRPIGNQPRRYEVLRAKAKELAALANTLCPESREKAHAFTQLEDAVMWFNAAIARNENESSAVVVWEEMSEAQAQLKQDIEAFSKISPSDRIVMLATHEREEA